VDNNYYSNNSGQERANLHKAIWQIAEDLRGSVDGWDFKNYVLGMMFYRYISENTVKYFNAIEHNDDNLDFDYSVLGPDSQISDVIVKEAINSIGFFIHPSQLFCNVLKSAKNDQDLNIHLTEIFKAIEGSTKGTDSQNNFEGLFADIDLNNNRLGSNVVERNKRLTALLNGVAKMNLNSNGIDTFGDAYEFLMSMYASNAGKSGGEFFTPQGVSELLARITIVGKKSINKVYDPACGSGSLLLQFEKLLGKSNLGSGLFGQEINPTTYNLCRINMFLHNIGFDKFDIALGNTLTDPKHDDFVPFEAIVSNPPYAVKWEGDSNPTLIDDPRYSPAGVLAPKSKADMAFVMHALSYLASSGTAAIVCFPGIFYRNGAEQKIRKYLVDKNFCDAIIALPDKLFFGTGISTYILVLKKSRKSNKVLFIDASNEFVKDTNNNRLSNQNITQILSAYIDKIDIPHFAQMVSIDKIKDNDYNLSVSTYIQKFDNNPKVNIVELNQKITNIVAQQSTLRTQIDAIVAGLQDDAM